MSRPRKKADATASPSLISRLLAKRGVDPLAARLRAERARRRTARLLGLWQASRLYRAVTLLRELLSATELRHFSLLLAPPGLTALFRCLILPLLTDDFPMMADWHTPTKDHNLTLIGVLDAVKFSSRLTQGL